MYFTVSITQWHQCHYSDEIIVRWGLKSPASRLLNHLFSLISKKISKLRVTGLCEGNSPVTGEFPAQMASNVETVSLWWRHHVLPVLRRPAANRTANEVDIWPVNFFFHMSVSQLSVHNKQCAVDFDVISRTWTEWVDFEDRLFYCYLCIYARNKLTFVLFHN